MSSIESEARRPTGTDALLEITRDHLAAIQLCLSNHLRMPALVLIYCGIDFMGFLARAPTSQKINKNDFIHWAESNMDCQKKLGVSGLDLYAARCGMVHNYTSDSTLSKKGKASRIVYAWGNADIVEPTQFLQSLGHPEKFIKIEALFDAFTHGIDVFGEELTRDREFTSLVLERSRKLFCAQPFFPTDKNRHLWE